MTHSPALPAPLLLGAALLLAACAKDNSDKGADSGQRSADSAAAFDSSSGASADAAGGAARRVAMVEGFKTPESVRFDSAQNVWFVSNVNGNPSVKDNNGFISRVRGDGSAVDSLMFIAGGRNGVTLNAPKGSVLVGDTLVVLDIDAVRMFNARTGAPVGSVNLAPLGATFLNDIARGPDGALYITDTGIRFGANGQVTHPGRDRIFKIAGRTPSVAIADTALAGPNGIAWDAANNRFVVVPFNSKSLMTWAPGGKPAPLAQGVGQFDGVAVLSDGRVLASTWADSSIYVASNGTLTKLASGLPGPADFGVNASGDVLAVPLFTENRVEFWSIGGR